MTIDSALSQGERELTEAGVPDARLQAASLLAHVTNRTRVYFLAHPDEVLSDNVIAAYRKTVERRAAREPYQYITGRQEFYGLEFDVTSDVLIPRPETEILVERAVDVLGGVEVPRFCEIGVGSGCISISMLVHLSSASAVAGDISSPALAIAERNAVKHGVRSRIRFVRSDIFSDVAAESFHAIVSNPPYVPDADILSLEPEVRDNEPHIALAAGLDGLDMIRRVILDAPGYLCRDGILLVEMGFNQSNSVLELIDDRFWDRAEMLADLQGIPRILFAVKR